MNDYQKYLAVLFRPGESICATNDVQGTQIELFDVARLRQPRQFVAVNPLVFARRDATVTSHRNLMFEFDEGTTKEQLAEIVDKRVPFSTLVHSGGKSVHLVIALLEGVSPEDYAFLHKRIRYVLWRSDPTSKNPSRLTRAPGAERSPGVVQELIDIARPRSTAEVRRWIGQFKEHVARCEAEEEAKAAAKLARLQATEKGNKAPVDVETLHFLETGETVARSRHARLLAACFELQECGYAEDEAMVYIERAADRCGITADPKRADEAETVVNYVYSK